MTLSAWGEASASPRLLPSDNLTLKPDLWFQAGTAAG